MDASFFCIFVSGGDATKPSLIVVDLTGYLVFFTHIYDVTIDLIVYQTL